METEPVPKLMLRFALPAVVGMVAGAIYNIVDRIFVGHYVGPAGLAAITVSFPPMLMTIAFALLICIGGSSRVAILFGAKRIEEAERALASTFVLLGCAGALFIAASLLFADDMLRLAGGTGEVLETARPYLKIVLLGAPFALFGFGANFLVRASGSPKYAMCTQIVGALANVALDALFIVTLDMGVAGAAYGTIAAQAISAAFGLAFFRRKDAPLRIRARHIRLPKWEMITKIFSVGSAPFFMEISFVVYMTIMNQLVLKYGGDAGLSAMGIFLSLDSLIFLPAMAVGEATQPIVGYNYGAGKPERVVKAIRFALMIAVGFYVVSGALAEIFAPQLMGLARRLPRHTLHGNHDNHELRAPGARQGRGLARALLLPPRLLHVRAAPDAAAHLRPQGRLDVLPLRRHRRQHNSRLLPNLDNPLAQKPAGARGEIAEP